MEELSSLSTQQSSTSVLPTAMITTGCLTIVLASILAYTILLQRQRTKNNTKQRNMTAEEHEDGQKEEIFDYDRYPGGSITIYYATQTGTAESFSQSLEREGIHHGFLVHVIDLEDAIQTIQLKQQQEQETEKSSMAEKSTTTVQLLAPRSVFITATYGEGEAPDGAVPFCQWLQRITDNNNNNLFDTTTSNATSNDDDDDGTTRKSILSNVEYAVFGLGNTQYEHYNATSKFIDHALHIAGATRIIPLGLGDDNGDIETDFDTWKDQHLWPTLKQRYNCVVPHANGNSIVTTKSNPIIELPKCPLSIVYHDVADSQVVHGPNYNLPLDQIHTSSRHYYTAYECPIKEVRELQTVPSSSLTASNEMTDSTVHVEIDISAARQLRTDIRSTLSYNTADNLGVLPINSEIVVERVAKALGYDLNQIISVVPSPDGGDWHGIPFPCPIPIRECLLRYLDLTSAPRRSDLKRLSLYCSDVIDQKALVRMSTKEGRQEYKEKILDQYVGIVDLLRLCPSIHMPLEHFIHFCSPLQTRFFTISSSSSVHPQSIHLTVAVTKHRREDGSVFNGVCSTHLSSTNPDSKSNGTSKMVRIFHRPSTFRLPSDPTKPILLIGPGTGIAPMRALLQEREYQRTVLQQPVGSNTLYFGCKHQSQDYLYRDEIETWAQKPGGILDQLYVAFSRDQPKKIYVQDLLRQNGTETWNLIRDDITTSGGGGGAYIYVCGGVKMGQDVTEAIKEIISIHGNMSMEAAKDYLSKLSQNGRFVQELWA